MEEKEFESVCELCFETVKEVQMARESAPVGAGEAGGSLGRRR